MTHHTITSAAAALAVNKATISRHAARLKLGTRIGGVVILSAGEVTKLRRAVARARAGNPGARNQDGTFK